MKKKFTLRALFVFAMILSVSFVNNVFAQTAPSLGTAASFGVLANTTVTNTGNTVVSGNLGVSPGTAVTGFPPGVVNGTIFTGAGSTAGQAQIDAAAAFNNITGQACTTDLTGQDLGGLTLTPGVFCFDTSAFLSGTRTLILNAQGNPNAVFIFKIGSTLTTATGSSVSVINGGSSCNVFFQVGSSATLGTGTSFQGNILARTSITLNTGADLDGRALALGGAVTLDTNNISECGSIAPTAATVSVSGRVLSSRGRGISNAMVHLINQNGEIQTYKTNRSGYYTFQDIEVGETYIFNVYAKRYFFNAQVITLTEELAELDFTAQ